MCKNQPSNRNANQYSVFSGILFLAVTIWSTLSYAELHRSWNELINGVASFNFSGPTCPVHFDRYGNKITSVIDGKELKACIDSICGDRTIQIHQLQLDADRLRTERRDAELNELKMAELQPKLDAISKVWLEVERQRIKARERAFYRLDGKLNSPTDLTIANLNLLLSAEPKIGVGKASAAEKMLVAAKDELNLAFYPLVLDSKAKLGRLSVSKLAERVASFEKEIAQLSPNARSALTAHLMDLKTKLGAALHSNGARKLSLADTLAYRESELAILKSPQKYPEFTQEPPELKSIYPHFQESLNSRSKNLQSSIEKNLENCMADYRMQITDGVDVRSFGKTKSIFDTQKQNITKKYLNKLSSQSQEKLKLHLSKSELMMPLSIGQYSREFTLTIDAILKEGQRTLTEPMSDELGLAISYDSKSANSDDPFAWITKSCKDLRIEDGAAALAWSNINEVEVSSAVIRQGLPEQNSTLAHELFHILDIKLNRIELSSESAKKLKLVRDCVDSQLPSDMRRNGDIEIWAEAGAIAVDPDAATQAYCSEALSSDNISNLDFIQSPEEDHQTSLFSLLQAQLYRDTKVSKSCEAVMKTLKEKSGINIQPCFKLLD
jgi:hypothetical protein